MRLADLFHSLIIFRYGASRLFPYTMKRIDNVPILLKRLPFHSLARGSTEGGERSHYQDQLIYYGRTSRGGGKKRQDPILALFKYKYRLLRARMRQKEKETQEKFESFVMSKFKDLENQANFYQQPMYLSI